MAFACSRIPSTSAGVSVRCPGTTSPGLGGGAAAAWAGAAETTSAAALISAAAPVIPLCALDAAGLLERFPGLREPGKVSPLAAFPTRMCQGSAREAVMRQRINGPREAVDDFRPRQTIVRYRRPPGSPPGPDYGIPYRLPAGP
ncbi:hypothetical protein GCM10010324_50640 [Streptomyces hiroshimensis]|uniref:Uncharacterized protein n=1 Tax=Streptomyces hiroshimensis TaxID=66424 RepID=A0ABQ2YZ36_9ACTN|nr:hypothetical protein GCM10010324_50640 [Streptomyces hiroshimensis]